MRKAIHSGAILFFVLTLCAGRATAQDWPQWRGPDRDAHVLGFQPPHAWPGLWTNQWKVDVGAGSDTPALVGGKLYVFARQGDDEVLRCLDADSGKELWSEGYTCGPATGPASSHPGPRSSPLVAEGRVVTFGVRGTLSCVDAKTGKMRWRKDPIHGWPIFFTSMSPIIVDGLCVVGVGGATNGAIVAYHLKSGGEKWRWTGDGPAYGSPMEMKVGGRTLVVVETDKNIIALKASTGELVWRAPYAVHGMGANATTPIVDGQTLIYTGSNRGTTAVRLEWRHGKVEAAPLWQNDDNSPQFASPVLRNGLLFGLSAKGNFYCIDANTGKTCWTEDNGRRGGFGSIIDAGAALLALTPKSRLIVFEPSDKQYLEVATIKLSDTPSYSYPVVAGNRIFIQDQKSIALWTEN